MALSRESDRILADTSDPLEADMKTPCHTVCGRASRVAFTDQMKALRINGRAVVHDLASQNHQTMAAIRPSPIRLTSMQIMLTLLVAWWKNFLCCPYVTELPPRE